MLSLLSMKLISFFVIRSGRKVRMVVVVVVVVVFVAAFVTVIVVVNYCVIVYMVSDLC